jgi:arginyl-tRNA synthetase
MNIHNILQNAVAKAIEHLYSQPFEPSGVQINRTPKEFQGSFTVVVFPFVKLAKKSPDVTAQELGAYMKENVAEVTDFNVVKGFLNLEISTNYWQGFLDEVLKTEKYGHLPSNGKKVMVEYSSPNTNKPLHLGHIRNILLGWSCSKILTAAGYEVVKVQIVNDRGVAICKSMLSWLKYGKGKTPESTKIKSDHFVGDYYVLFEQKLKAEYAKWQTSKKGIATFEKLAKAGQDEASFFKDYKNKFFNEYSKLGAEVREMLLKWENHDPETIALWKQMNQWVYNGFNKTYDDLGVTFDKLYYESNTYLLGKDIVDDGLAKNVFFKKDDSSVWVDLTDAGHDQKLVLRSDGTSVYMTQDLGTARMRFEDFGCEKVVYVVADEQNYHFQVLFEILKRLEEPYAAGLYHLAYGMVELPTGRMKTREGTVVDADDLMEEVIKLAKKGIDERGEASGASASERAEVARMVGMSALKFFILKVNARRRIIFNPEESLDFEGQTGPYIQYSYARMNSVLNRAQKEQWNSENWVNYTNYQPIETEMLLALHEYPEVLKEAAQSYDPSHIANYCYNLAKSYHKFWHDLSIFNAETEEAKAFRLELSRAIALVLTDAMGLIGIEMPNRM